MSYNISAWIVEELVDLVIPIESFFTNPRTDWHPEIKLDVNQIAEFCISDCRVIGKIVDKNLHVIKIEWRGECSGTGLNWILEPALKTSTGTLIASCVWEGGDCINQLQCRNGDVKWVDIEI